MKKSRFFNKETRPFSCNRVTITSACCMAYMGFRYDQKCVVRTGCAGEKKRE